MRNNGEIHWKKTAIMKYLMAFATVVGFAIFFAIAFLIPHGRGIRFQLFLFAGYPVILLIMLMGLRSDKYIPREYGTSREKLYLRYIKNLERYRWDEISRIYPKRTRGSTKLVIESVDREVSLIPFLLRNERERIIEYYEKRKELV